MWNCMIKCSGCGREFSTMISPLHCSCGTITKTDPIAIDTVKPNAWQILHSRYAAAIESDQWSETVERHWLDTEFTKLIPCGSCGANGPTYLKPSIYHRPWLRLSLHGEPITSSAPSTLNQQSKPSQSSDAEPCTFSNQGWTIVCVAVTSVSLLPNHLAVQETCLNTWREPA